MKIKLIATAHIPDENWVESTEHPVQQKATNYAGAELEVSDAVAEELIRDGKAVNVEDPVESAPEPAAFRSRRSE